MCIIIMFLIGSLLLNAMADSTIVISVADKKFVAEVEDTATGKAFVEKLPLTLDMSELNGNEKYCYGVTLPTASRRYDTIEAGDLMLYGSNCVVLFYDKAGGYSYTRIGKIKSTEGLVAALGKGDVTVKFEKALLNASITMTDGKPQIGVESNLPSWMKIKTLATRFLPASENEWKDYDTLTNEEKELVHFFKLQIAEEDKKFFVK